jgi:hemerythrin superfamily protein
MNAVELLKKDHSHVRELFASFESAGDGAHERKQTLCEQITNELQIHTQIEEEIFYPAVREAGAGQRTSEDENEEQVLEAFEEHNLAKIVINDVRGLSSSDESFNAKMKVLKDVVEHHIKEEEGEMFPRLHTTLGEQRLEELGLEMAERKRALASGGITGTIAKMVNKAFDTLSGGRETKKASSTKSTSSHRAAANGTRRATARPHARLRSKPRTDSKAQLAKTARSKSTKSARGTTAVASRKTRPKNGRHATQSRSH